MNNRANLDKTYALHTSLAVSEEIKGLIRNIAFYLLKPYYKFRQHISWN